MGEQEPSPKNGPEEHAIMMGMSEFTASYFEKNKDLFITTPISQRCGCMTPC